MAHNVRRQRVEPLAASGAGRMRRNRTTTGRVSPKGYRHVRYLALALDYDGTLATNGKVNKKTIATLERAIDSSRKLILVTGRQLDDLQRIFPRLDLFARVVAENGALLYRPEAKEEVVLGEAPPDELVEMLRKRTVRKLSVGRSIVATVEPHHDAVMEAIHDLGLGWHIIFNKGNVMALPANVTKATGLRVALDELGLSPHNVVGVGDAENDHDFLDMCECAVAVANALPAVRKRADLTTAGERGAGVSELIEQLLADDLAGATKKLARHDILLGTLESGKEVRIPPYGASILVAGPSGSGKSTTTTALLERFAEAGYQFCLIDPEGDYENFPHAVTLGNAQFKPNIDEVLQLLEQPRQSVVINLLDIPLADRPGFFTHLLPRLQELRVSRGRPHWIVVDEVHHLMPVTWQPAPESIPQEFSEMLLITVHPDMVAPAVLASVNTVVAVGDGPEETLEGFAKAVKGRAPKLDAGDGAERGDRVVVWRRGARGKPQHVQVTPASMERRRHKRKYAEGELIAEEHFFFRGPREELNLRAQNLVIFTQLAEGVDDETWDFHLRRGDYTNWFRHVIKDDELAEAAESVAGQANLSPCQTRERIREEIEERYTLPA
jgi:HAD superfamily hydrolase (TIGR01484 family)